MGVSQGQIYPFIYIYLCTVNMYAVILPIAGEVQYNPLASESPFNYHEMKDLQPTLKQTMAHLKGLLLKKSYVNHVWRWAKGFLASHWAAWRGGDVSPGASAGLSVTTLAVTECVFMWRTRGTTCRVMTRAWTALLGVGVGEENGICCFILNLMYFLHFSSMKSIPHKRFC